MRTTAPSLSRAVVSSCLAAATRTLVSATKTNPPTPSNFVPFPSSRPTSVPTSRPSYGPASMTVVEEIMGGVLSGIIFLIFTYFLFGYYLYVGDMDAYEKAMEEKELEDARAAEAGECGGHEESSATVDDASDDEVLNPLQPTKPPPSTGPASTSNLSNRRLAMPPGQYFKGDDLPRPPQRGLGYLTPATSEESDAALMRPRPPSHKAEALAGGGAAGDVESSGGHETRPLLGGSEGRRE